VVEYFRIYIDSIFNIGIHIYFLFIFSVMNSTSNFFLDINSNFFLNINLVIVKPTGFNFFYFGGRIFSYIH